MATILGQRCTVFLDENGVQRFKIDSSIDAVEPGDLPIYGPLPYTSNIFVHKIIAPLDPKSDTFLRVGNVADLTTLALGRETAVGLNQAMYLGTEFTVVYDDIATASTAKLLIQQRVDNLIADWHTYNEKFLAPLTTPPDYSSIPLPLTTSLESAAKDAYASAHAELLAAKTTSAVAAVTATTTITLAAAANQDAVDAVSESQKCSNLLGQFNTGNTAIESYRQSVNTFVTASITFQTASATFDTAAQLYITYGIAPTAPQLATFTAAESAFNTAKGNYDSALAAMTAAVAAEAVQGQPVLDTFHTSMAQACTTKIADVQIAAQKKATADKAAADAATAKKAADTALSAALIADTEAYLAVKVLCPTFVATSP